MQRIETPEEYRQLPELLRKQVDTLSRVFEYDEDVGPVVKLLYQKYDVDMTEGSNLKQDLCSIATLNVIASDYLFAAEWFPYVYCYDNMGNIITLAEILSVRRHSLTFLGHYNGSSVVLRWYQSERRDTTYEMNIYDRLAASGCPLPCFSTAFSVWNSPILMLERLSKLDIYDDPFIVASHVLRQLRHLHRSGVHNAIKPANILKRVQNGNVSYFLLDYTYVATKKLKYGYHRWSWAPKWSSQTPQVIDQITTAKNDFIELGYVMKTMENWRTGAIETRSGFVGKLREYMDRVNRVDEKNIRQEDYDDLIAILVR